MIALAMLSTAKDINAHEEKIKQPVNIFILGHYSDFYLPY